MAFANVRGVRLHYEILGESGPWMALMQGGRRPLEGVKELATHMAARGYRVMIHDRRNCGSSDVVIAGTESEYEIWAEDLHLLLSQLGAEPAIIGGASAGCRTALLFALHHPESCQALLLQRVSGGQVAADMLSESYYTRFIDVAREGGMKAVCETDHFKSLIEKTPENEARLMAMDVDEFVRVMDHWREYFLRGASQPVIGATREEIASLTMPACILQAGDPMHPLEVAEELSKLLPNSEFQRIPRGEEHIGAGGDVFFWPESVSAELFGNFLTRNSL